VHVDQGSMGEYSIDFATYGWFPDVLPSEAAELSSDDEDDENESEADERGDVDRPRS
jgi:methylated-DNA-protein-cysteine methyltransferase-like protein